MDASVRSVQSDWIIEGGGTYDFTPPPKTRHAVQTSGTFPALSTPKAKPKGGRKGR